MRTVTAPFTAAVKRADAVGVRRVYMKRRYWSGSAYTWESSWVELALSEVVGVSPVNWQLDTDQLNEFKVANVTLTAKNTKNEWRSDNTAGKFAVDTTSPTYGYEPYWTKFQIRAGFVLADGTEELVTLFTGLAVEFVSDSGAGTVQVRIQGLETLLLNAKAEGIATTVTTEAVGTGNGSNKVFTTLNPGVGGVTAVYLAGVVKLEGVDYAISNTNVAASGATITFTNAPNVGVAVTATYYYWPQTKQFHEIVSSLLTAGGITAPYQNVQAVIFSGSVVNNILYTTQADWDSGTKTDIDTADTAGDAHTDFAGTDFRSAQTWSTAMTGWSGDTGIWSSSGTYLTATAPGLIYRSLDKAQGTWEVKYTNVSTAADRFLTVGFMARSYWTAGVEGIPTVRSGYSVQLRLQTAGATMLLVDEAGLTLASVSITNNTSEHTLKITRTGVGRIRVYLDGVLKIDVTNTTYTAGLYFTLNRTASDTGGEIRVRDIVVPTASATPLWSGPTIDFGSTPTDWGTVTITKTLNSGTLTFETRTSADGSTWDAWTALPGTNIPASTKRRYAQIRWYTTHTNTGLTGDPVVSDITVQAITGSAPVQLPAFTGVSVYEAIQKIGEFTNYEFGFTPDEVFFFRGRTPGSSVLSLTQADYLSRIGSLSTGYENVYAIVRAVYGAYSREVTGSATDRTSPVARVSNRRYEIQPDSNIQILASVDIASGVASTLYTYLSQPRRRMKATTKFLPQLELADVVTVTLANNKPFPEWYFGDPDVYYGRGDVFWWGEKNQFLYGLNARVIGVRYDVQKLVCEFDLEEVL